MWTPKAIAFEPLAFATIHGHDAFHMPPKGAQTEDLHETGEEDPLSAIAQFAAQADHSVTTSSGRIFQAESTHENFHEPATSIFSEGEGFQIPTFHQETEI